MKIFSTHSLPSYPCLPLALFFVCPLFIEKIQNFKQSTAQFNCKKDFALLASPSYLNLKQFKYFIWIEIYSFFFATQLKWLVNLIFITVDILGYKKCHSFTDKTNVFWNQKYIVKRGYNFNWVLLKGKFEMTFSKRMF